MYEFQKKLKRKPDGLMYEWIRVTKGVYLSIQCSYLHYSSPQESNLDPTKYESYEVAIIVNSRERVKVPEIKDFSREIREFVKKYTDGSAMPFVPAEEVERLYKLLKEWGNSNVSDSKNY